MEADSTQRSRVLEDFMPRYMAAGGDETTGTYVQAQIERWSKDPTGRAGSIAMIADRIERFAQWSVGLGLVLEIRGFDLRVHFCNNN